VSAGRTKTSVTRLTEESRIEELSRMLGGAGITDAVRASAREMLARRVDGALDGRGAKAKGERRKSGSEG
jgi:DNA repair protein RecN (Recombination protein N)